MEVGIVGGSGYGGAELLRLLSAHPALKIRTVAARREAGLELAELHPNLAGAGLEGTLVPAEPEPLRGCDLVFLATPHEASLELAPALLDQGSAVVDLSGAYRLPPATFTAWYGIQHTAPGLSPAAYGLPELFRPALRRLAGAGDGRLVASPGCYPTAALLALGPLAGAAPAGRQSALVDPSSVVVAGMSGTSGAGKGLREDLHVSHAVQNVAPYGAPRHRHTPEIEAGWAALAGLGQPAAVSFTPHLVPMSRGLLCTVSAALCDGVEERDVVAAFRQRYEPEPFVTLLPVGSWPATTHVRGGNGAHVGLAVDGRCRRVTVACAIDNLVKGAAGQAIQAANVVLGLPETAGLTAAGVYP